MPYRRKPAPSESAEIELGDRAASGSSALRTVALLALGLGVAIAVLTRFRVVFLLFLPLGIGAVPIVSRWFQRRIARLSHGTLLFESQTLWARRRVGSIATDSGVAIETRGANLVVNGVERMTIRVAGSRGALSWKAAGADSAEDQVARLRDILQANAIAVYHDGSVPLAGAVSVSEGGEGRVIEWRAARAVGFSLASAALTAGAVVLAAFVLVEGIWLVASGLGLAMLLFLLGSMAWASTRGDQGARTTIWVGREGWTITRARGAAKDRDHGVQTLEARLLGTPDAPGLVLLSAGREVLAVDDGLSLAELRFIAEQIEHAGRGGLPSDVA